MHELSIAENLLDLVLAELASGGVNNLRGETVTAVRVRIGRLSPIVPEALQSAFVEVRRHTPLAATRLEIEQVATIVWCPVCQCEQEPTDPRRLVCPQCGQRTPELRQGLELELMSIELADASV